MNTAAPGLDHNCVVQPIPGPVGASYRSQDHAGESEEPPGHRATGAAEPSRDSPGLECAKGFRPGAQRGLSEKGMALQHRPRCPGFSISASRVSLPLFPHGPEDMLRKRRLVGGVGTGVAEEGGEGLIPGTLIPPSARHSSSEERASVPPILQPFAYSRYCFNSLCSLLRRGPG